MNSTRANLMNFESGSWVWSTNHGEFVRILDVETVWNYKVCQVWSPRTGTVERVSVESLSPAPPAPPTAATGLDRITWAVSAARIADALTQDVLLAPLEAGVIPLPHQLHALTRAVTGDRVRYLLADEVGLGKTIEAGLIFRELKLRGLVKRVLVVAPRGLVTQWVQKMHFETTGGVRRKAAGPPIQATRDFRLIRVLFAPFECSRCTSASPAVRRSCPVSVLHSERCKERGMAC